MTKTNTLDSETPVLNIQNTDEVAKLRAKHVIPIPGPLYAKPIQIVRGQGVHLFDEKGNQYLDAFAGVATVSIGHCHPHFVKKVSQQLATLGHTTTIYLNPTMGDYAKRLVAKAKLANPEMEVCYFTNSGSEATEMAALIAKNYTGSSEFVSLRHSYHGRTLMAMALTGQSIWRHSTPYPTGVYHTPTNYTYRRPDGMSPKEYAKYCANEFSELIKCSTSGKIAALYVEPISGVGGVISPEPEFFPAMYDIVKKAGGLFLADEVQTGFGRTGQKFWGIQHSGVKPDIITLAKGMGNGYPLGALVTTRKIAEAIHGKLHFNTYGGSPVAMAAASAVMDVMEKDDLVNHSHEVGTHLMGRLKKICAKSRWIGDLRGRGLMIGMELVKDQKTKEPAPEATAKFLELAKDRKLLVGKGGIAGNVIRIKPPLVVTKKDADLIADITEDVLKSL